LRGRRGLDGYADSWTRRLYTVRQDLSTKFLATCEAYGARPLAVGLGIPEFSPELPTTKDGPLLSPPQSLAGCTPLFNRLTSRLPTSTSTPGVSRPPQGVNKLVAFSERKQPAERQMIHALYPNWYNGNVRTLGFLKRTIGTKTRGKIATSGTDRQAGRPGGLLWW
jgi:hypothetical protein